MHWFEAIPLNIVPQWLNGPTYNGPTYESHAKCFSSRNLLGLPRLSNKCVTDQFRTARARRQMSLSASIINPANKNGYGAWGYPFCGAQDHLPCSAYWAYEIRSIGGVYQPYKAVTSLWVNIKPIKPTTSTARAHQVYRVFQDHQEAVAHLTTW